MEGINGCELINYSVSGNKILLPKHLNSMLSPSSIWVQKYLSADLEGEWT